jgi:hypothetical protein
LTTPSISPSRERPAVNFINFSSSVTDKRQNKIENLWLESFASQQGLGLP